MTPAVVLLLCIISRLFAARRGCEGAPSRGEQDDAEDDGEHGGTAGDDAPPPGELAEPLDSPRSTSVLFFWPGRYAKNSKAGEGGHCRLDEK